MDEYFEIFLSELGPLFSKIQPTDEQIETYSGLVPSKLLEYWRQHGWSGYRDGLFWFVNPSEYAPAVEAWLNHTNLTNKEEFLAIGRSAFGKIFLWSKKTGQSVTLAPLTSQIFISPPSKRILRGDETKELQYFISGEDADGLDFFDSKDKKLFKQALSKVGAVSADEMYAFEPALCIGGIPTINNLAKVKIVEHLILLEQLCDVEVSYIDVSRHL